MLSTRNGQLVLEEDDTLVQKVPFNHAHDHEALSLELQVHQGHSQVSTAKHIATQHAWSNAIEDEENDSDDEDDSSIDLAQILKELSSTVKRLEKSVSQMRKDNSSSHNQVSAIQTIQSQDANRIRGLIDKVDDQEDKINVLIGIVARQDQQIQSLTHKLDASYVKENKNNLLISGIAETQGEDCYQEVANFLKNTLKVDKPIPLTQAYRFGKGNRRPILAKLKSVGDKAVVYAKTDRLYTVNKGRDIPFFVADHLPDAWAEKRRSNHHFKQQNKRLPLAQQQKVEIKGGILSIQNQVYEPLVKVPSILQMCNISPERKRFLREMEIIEGGTEHQDGSIFVGYAAEAFTAQSVQNLYDALKLRIPDATHIACAFKFPGTDIAKNQGFVDDGEFGAGRALLNLLHKNKAYNKVLFITRHYGGQHIGVRRFQLMEKVALKALNEIIKKEQDARRPLTDEELRKLNEEIAKQAEEAQRLRELQAQNPWNQPNDSMDEANESIPDSYN